MASDFFLGFPGEQDPISFSVRATDAQAFFCELLSHLSFSTALRSQINNDLI